MQVIDFFIGSNIPDLRETFVRANCYQITLSNNMFISLSCTISFSLAIHNAFAQDKLYLN